MKKQLFFVLALIGLMLMGGGINAYADLASYTNTATYHKPSPSPGTDYEVIYTTLTKMVEFNTAGWASDGDGAAAWKAATRTINNWIDPTTDLAGEGTFPTKAVQYGIQFKKDGYKGVYFFITGCSKIKAYMAGHASKSNKLKIEAVNKDDSSDKPSVTAATECAMYDYCGLELTLDKAKKYRVRILDSNGNDAQLYALRLYGDYVSSEVTTYKITPQISLEGAGVVTMDPLSGEVIKDKSITLTANANVGYRFKNWTDASGNILSTDASYTFTPTANTTITANFIQLKGLHFTLSETAYANGFAPASIYGLEGETVNIPKAYHVYAAGKTLTGWTDGTNTYPISGQYTFAATNAVTLTPVFTDNTVNLTDVATETTVVWEFGPSNGAPVLAFENGTNWNSVQGNAYLVQQAVVNGQTIDVGMMFETRSSQTGLSGNGKIYNVGRTNEAQVNANTVFRLPVIRNSKIKMVAYYDISATTIDGSTDYTAGKTVTYTYTGEAKDVEIIVKDGGYYYTISVTYPPAKSFSLTTADTEPYSLYLDYPVTIPEGIEAYTGALDAAEETLTMKTVEGTIPANTAVIVKSATADTYVFKETYTAASIESNSLKGVTADTDIATLVTAGKTLLTLGTKGGKVAFRKPATGTTQVKANKAYLLVNTPSSEGAKTVKMIFDGETTGISEFTANEDVTNAPLFNLNGQRVNANAKGLLIKNGKKIIIK